jgi:hypothetical protein
MSEQEHRRRGTDRDKWPDERIDEFARLVAPSVATGAQNHIELSMLKDGLQRHEKLVRAGFERIEATLESIEAHVSVTNGRVTQLEKSEAVEAALRVAAAAAVEERRQTLALRVAQHGWIRPTVGGGAAALVVAVATRFMG